MPRLPHLAPGDIDAFVNLSSQNLSNLLAFIKILESIWASHGVSSDIINDLLYAKVVPAFGFSLAAGNLFYAAQSVLAARRSGRTDLCAQPFGVNTPGAFVFLSSLILPVFSAALKSHRPDEAARISWQTAVAANMLQGCFEVLFAAVGPWLQRAVPLLALLTSLSSIGMAYLYMNIMPHELDKPILSLVCFMLVMSSYLGDVDFGRVPVSIYTMALGVAIAWTQAAADDFHGARGGVSLGGVANASRLVGIYPPQTAFDAVGAQFAQLGPHLSVVMPIALTVAVGTIQCVQFAHKAGDSYSLRGSMVGDGMATMVSAALGGIFGMTVYIGHPTFKAQRAGFMYNVATAVLFVLLCSTGLVGLILAVIPIAALNPIIAFVGLAVCADTLKLTPHRHFPAFIFGLGPGLAAWCVDQIRTAAPDLDLSRTSLAGLQSFGGGYLLSSMVLTAVLVNLIDRCFSHAALWAAVASLLSLFGLMHGDQIKLLVGPSDLGWRFAVGYAFATAFFGVMWLLQRLRYVHGPHLELKEEETLLAVEGMRSGSALESSLGGSYLPAELHEPILPHGDARRLEGDLPLVNVVD
ncbi:hypothetical protein AB1Y20_003926 [Prymnesium parvum]|uniref:Uncharacterized protein n=1 Tax=Prymnesium parvum TaxID=97485 RepID=A0AB34J6K6_PRYPA